MNIKFEIELDDFFVFSDYLLKTSPLMLKTIRKGQMWWASGPLVGGLILSIFKGYSSENSLTILAILSVAISLPMFFMYPHYYKYRNKKQIIKLHANGNYKSVLGEHEMTIYDDYLAEKTAYNDGKVQWSSISKIESTSDHTFIFTDDITAYIVPHKRIKTGDFSQFIDKLKTLLNKSRTEQTPK